jgi:hypothetical protein
MPRLSLLNMNHITFVISACLLVLKTMTTSRQDPPPSFLHLPPSHLPPHPLCVRSFMKTIKERLTEGGASGAFFFFTKDEKFIAKSCTLDEIAHIRRSSLMLSKYFQDNPESFITRVSVPFTPLLSHVCSPSSHWFQIYGAYKLRIYGTSFYFFVTNNIFLNPNDEVINEKYDLKGSWVKRNSTPPQIGQRVTCTHCNQKYIFLGKKKKKQKSYK